MERFFLCKGRRFLCCGRIFIQMLLNQRWLRTENYLKLQRTETLRDIKELVQGCRALSRLPASQPGIQWVPLALGDWEGGEAISGENNARKEAGKWHNRQGKKEGQRELVTLQTPTPSAKKGPQERLKNCVEIFGMQEILDSFFSKGQSLTKIKFKGEARKYSHRKDIAKLWLSLGRWLKEHCHDSDGIKKCDASFMRGAIFHVVILGVKHANNEGSRNDVCCLQAKLQGSLSGPSLPLPQLSPTLEGILHSLMPRHNGSSRISRVEGLRGSNLNGRRGYLFSK